MRLFKTIQKRKLSKEDLRVEHEIVYWWIQEVNSADGVDFLMCRTFEGLDFQLLVTAQIPEWHIQKLLLICRLICIHERMRI